MNAENPAGWTTIVRVGGLGARGDSASARTVTRTAGMRAREIGAGTANCQIHVSCHTAITERRRRPGAGVKTLTYLRRLRRSGTVSTCDFIGR